MSKCKLYVIVLIQSVFGMMQRPAMEASVTMLMPKKTKYRKQMRGRMSNDAQTGNKVSFGYIGLQAIGRGYLSTRQIEAARRVITRTLKRGGKIWIRVFPDKPITKRPAETRPADGDQG